MPDIRNRVGVNAPIEDVYDAIATREGVAEWWTTTVEGDARIGGELAFFFGGPDRYRPLEVVESTLAEPGAVALRAGSRPVGGHHDLVRPAPERR